MFMPRAMAVLGVSMVPLSTAIVQSTIISVNSQLMNPGPILFLEHSQLMPAALCLCRSMKCSKAPGDYRDRLLKQIAVGVLVANDSRAGNCAGNVHSRGDKAGWAQARPQGGCV
jgi:hypothetical protein